MVKIFWNLKEDRSRVDIWESESKSLTCLGRSRKGKVGLSDISSLWEWDRGRLISPTTLHRSDRPSIRAPSFCQHRARVQRVESVDEKQDSSCNHFVVLLLLQSTRVVSTGDNTTVTSFICEPPTLLASLWSEINRWSFLLLKLWAVGKILGEPWG